MAVDEIMTKQEGHTATQAILLKISLISDWFISRSEVTVR